MRSMQALIPTLILSAGASRRMGSPKALLPWGKTTVLHHLLDVIQTSSFRIITGAHHQQIQAAFPDLTDKFVVNAAWESGMGNSLAFGISQIKNEYPKANAVLILLVDQPLVDREYIRTLKDMASEHQNQVIASEYIEGFGVPAVIPASLWESILLESSQHGAKYWMRQQNNILTPERIPDLRDIDTPTAYKELHREWIQRPTKPTA